MAKFADIFRSQRSRTFRRLNEDLARAGTIDFDPAADKIVVMSDVHKGDRSPGSDDFLPVEPIYCRALAHYFEQGFSLVLAGDIEDGWECDYRDILERYRDGAFAAEKKFADAGRYFRVCGNHDAAWARPGMADRLLSKVLGKVTVHPALAIGKDIVIVHGHQGDILSDTFGAFSHLVNRFIWKPIQNRTGAKNTLRAAYNSWIRESRDRYLFQWAREKGVVLIAGHTHQGMFASHSKVDRLFAAWKKLARDLIGVTDEARRREGEAAVQMLERMLRASSEGRRRLAKVGELGGPSEPKAADPLLPCYFNDGCCCFTDGLTCIEIDQGQIRLVKWEMATVTGASHLEKARPLESVRISRVVYESAGLPDILAKVRGQQPGTPQQAMGPRQHATGPHKQAGSPHQQA